MNENDYPIIHFKTPQEWELHLKKVHVSAPGIWLLFAKKGTGVTSVTYDEALEVALCYGWIDGKTKTVDQTFWKIKFTPRGPRSNWSQRNCDIVDRLTKEGKMQSAGLEKVEAAKKDGRWAASYGSSKNMIMPDDFLNELGKNKKALIFFKMLNKSNTYAIYWQLQTAKKPETKQRRIKKIIEMLEKGEKLY